EMVSSTTSAYFRDSSSTDTSATSTDRSSEFRPLPTSSPQSSRSERTPSSCSDAIDRSVSSASTGNVAYDSDRNERVASIAESWLEPNTQLSEFTNYFIGLKTADEAAELTTPTSIRLYYQMPLDGSFASSIPLFLVYRSSTGIVFHFPIVEELGRWRVKYGESLNVTYPNVTSLLRHHILYAFVSPFEKGNFESFEVWKAFTSI
ncbi:hypothetical protein PFISCL1PPCAC_8604, partial [Pristionchus fissidentatus]